MVGGAAVTEETVWVELSGENLELARAELDGAAEALDATVDGSWEGRAELVSASGTAGLGSALAHRLALARRCLVELTVPPADRSAWFRSEGGSARSARFRPLGGARSALLDPEVDALARAYVDGGGHIDLARPDRSFWFLRTRARLRLFEEAGSVDRRSFDRRRMPSLPFQRPVSLPPRLGRAAVNMARIRPGDRIVDPFVGTGALLIEAGLLGARCSGVDRDPAMVRGALRNLAHAKLSADLLRVGDAGEAFPPPDARWWDALVTDPPYGRQSGAGGEDPAVLVSRCLPGWSEHVRPGGHAVVIVPAGTPEALAGWRATVRVPDRVHRSLTREFRVYERLGRTGAVPTGP